MNRIEAALLALIEAQQNFLTKSNDRRQLMTSADASLIYELLQKAKTLLTEEGEQRTLEGGDFVKAPSDAAQAPSVGEGEGYPTLEAKAAAIRFGEQNAPTDEADPNSTPTWPSHGCG